jgi:copper chaperone
MDMKKALDLPMLGSLTLWVHPSSQEHMMIAFKVNDMTCGHCASTITRAVKEADRDAQVRINVGERLVEIEPKTSDADALRKAIAEAGYTPVAV